LAFYPWLPGLGLENELKKFSIDFPNPDIAVIAFAIEEGYAACAGFCVIIVVTGYDTIAPSSWTSISCSSS
jgi:hypothetical protein